MRISVLNKNMTVNFGAPHILRKSVVVVILLLNLFLSIAGVTAQSNQVDCSKLAFSLEDMPEELQNYAKEPIPDVSLFLKTDLVDTLPNKVRAFYSFTGDPNLNIQCKYFTLYQRAVRARRTFPDGNSREETTRYGGEIIHAVVIALKDESKAQSLYSQIAQSLGSLEQDAIQSEQSSRGLKFTDQTTERYGDESSTWIIIASVIAGTNAAERKMLSTFRIRSFLFVFFAGWDEGDFPGSYTDEGARVDVLDPVAPCKDAGLRAIKTWSDRLAIELGGPLPPTPTSPPVTTGQCSIKIDKDCKKLAVDDISQLTFTGIITGVKSVTDAATSVDLRITAEVSSASVASSPIKLTLKEEKDIRLQRTDPDPPSFKYVYKPRIRDFSYYDLIPGRAILEASFKNSSGNVLAKCSKEFTLIRTPVLLVHGIWSYSDEMKPMMNYLKSHGFEYVSNYNYGKNPPDDWRDGANGDIKNIALELSTFVYNNLETTLSIDNVNWSRFDIVAHSAGGLVAREYINNNPDKVRKLVTIATPHYGSDAANILVYWMRNSGRIEYDPSWAPTGHRKDVVYDERVRFLIDDTRKLAGTELLIGRYGVMVEQLTIPGDVVINDDASEYIQVPEEGRTRLTRNDIGALPWSLGVKPEIRAGDFIKNLNAPEYDRSLRGISLLCIAANRSDFGFFTVANDGIVTVASATSLAVRLHRPYQVIQDTDHTHVKNLKDTQYRVACFLNDREYTAFDVYSPVRIHVYDKDGNHTGPRNDGTLETQIPNSEYFEENNATHVIIYGNGEYRAVYEAYDNGNATFSITRQVADEGMKIISYNDVRIKKTATYTVTANPSAEAPLLEVDSNGDKVTDEKIKPSSYQFYPPSGGEGGDHGWTGNPLGIAAALFIIFIVAILIAKRDTLSAYLSSGMKTPVTEAEKKVTCPNCETLNLPSNRNCMKCGKTLQAYSFCEECGRRIPAGSVYCEYCGDKQEVV